MDQSTIQQFQRRLQGQREKLEKEIHEMAKAGRGVHTPGSHEVAMEDVGREEGENASEVEDYERKLAIEKNLEEQLSQVEVAIERIDEGTYGQCMKCGGEIPFERLEAYPAATTCVECA